MAPLQACSTNAYSLRSAIRYSRGDLLALTRYEHGHARGLRTEALREEVVVVRHAVVRDDCTVARHVLSHLLAGCRHDASAEAPTYDHARDLRSVAPFHVLLVGGRLQLRTLHAELRVDLLAAARRVDHHLADSYDHRRFAGAVLPDVERFRAHFLSANTQLETAFIQRNRLRTDGC